MGCIADMYREINVCEARYALSQAIMRSRAERGKVAMTESIGLSNDTMGPPLGALR
jgi:hypothetical protein